MPRKVILITDPGIDGAFAAALAMYDPELEVLALAGSPGNVTAAQATQNVHILVEQMDPPRWPRLGEAPQESFLVRHQKQHLAVDAASLQLLDQRGNGCDLRRGVAGIKADRRALVGLLRAAHRIGNEGREERGGNIVDAVEAEILKHVQRHALSRARQAADDDDPHL